jgi:hypothetical protein
MNNARIVLAAMALTFSFSFAHAESKKKEMKENRAAVTEACKEDAVTAGCTGKEMGKGLMKCLHAYHKAHKEYKMTATCESATKKMHDARKEAKEEAKEVKK